MIFFEGQEIKPTNFTIDCYDYMMESYKIQREIRSLYTNTSMTINKAKDEGVLTENTNYRLTTNMGNEIFEKIIDVLKALGKVLGKLFKDFIIFIKNLMFKDNQALLKHNKDLYESIPTDILDDLKYTWREPSQKLLSIIHDGIGNNNNDIDDITTIFDFAFEYTAGAKRFDTSFDTNVLDVMYCITNKLLPTGGVHNTTDFKKAYMYTLLSNPNRERGVSYERKCQIRDGMISRKVVTKIETTAREQQRAIEKHINIIEKIKASREFDIQLINRYREAVNALNNVAVATSNAIIESINVYIGQCRDVFVKILHHSNWHKDPIL